MFGKKLVFSTGKGLKLPLGIISADRKLHDILKFKNQCYMINCVPGMIEPSTGKPYKSYYAVKCSFIH